MKDVNPDTDEIAREQNLQALKQSIAKKSPNKHRAYMPQ